MKSKQGTSAAYLLRRLARDHPNILSAYERGDYPSVRAAAKAADIIKPPLTAFERVKQLWPSLSEKQRAEIRALP